MKLILITLLLINSAFSDEVTYIKKGDPAPENGYFITVSQEKKFREQNEENKKLVSINLQLKDLQLQQERRVDVLNERINGYQADNKYLMERVSSARADGFWNRTIYFVGGVLLTGGSVYLAGRLK
jgi:hypothetical protein